MLNSFDPDIISYSDYYPFGWIMPGREGSSDQYRYGFNGMERDDEVRGEGSHFTTVFRQYDPRTCRWFSPDPLTSKFAGWSPYVFAFDNPIWLNDPKGDAPPGIKEIIDEGKSTSTTFLNLLTAANITESNYNQQISFGTKTYTENRTGEIVLSSSEDIKFQVIKLTHELTNRKNIEEIRGADLAVSLGDITPQEYAEKLALIEVEGSINQIKVAAETGYRFKGDRVEGLNNLIDSYSQDQSIDLTEYISPNPVHQKSYEAQGKRLREKHLNRNPKNEEKQKEE